MISFLFPFNCLQLVYLTRRFFFNFIHWLNYATSIVVHRDVPVRCRSWGHEITLDGIWQQIWSLMEFCGRFVYKSPCLLINSALRYWQEHPCPCTASILFMNFNWGFMGLILERNLLTGRIYGTWETTYLIQTPHPYLWLIYLNISSIGRMWFLVHLELCWLINKNSRMWYHSCGFDKLIWI